MGRYHSRQNHLPSADQCTPKPNNGNKSEVSLGMSGHDSSLDNKPLTRSTCTRPSALMSRWSARVPIYRGATRPLCVSFSTSSAVTVISESGLDVLKTAILKPAEQNNKILHCRPNQSRVFEKMTPAISKSIWSITAPTVCYSIRDQGI